MLTHTAGVPAPGVVVVERTALSLATVLARRGKTAELAQRVRGNFGIELPDGPKRVVGNNIAFAGTAPGAWLATCETENVHFAASLGKVLTQLASVSDQSSGLSVLRLSGRNVRDTLAKLIPVDVHPRAFAVNQIAATAAAHVPVTLWRLADGIDGFPVFEIAPFRSYAASFLHALEESAAGYGFDIRR
jgi:sarcosine oxidase subunit gamma